MFTNFKKYLILFVLIFTANLAVSCERDFLKSQTPSVLSDSACGMFNNPFLASAALEYASRQAEQLANKQVAASRVALPAPIPVRLTPVVAGCWSAGPCSPGVPFSVSSSQDYSNNPLDPSNSGIKSPVIAVSPTAKK